MDGQSVKMTDIKFWPLEFWEKNHEWSDDCNPVTVVIPHIPGKFVHGYFKEAYCETLISYPAQMCVCWRYVCIPIDSSEGKVGAVRCANRDHAYQWAEEIDWISLSWKE